MMDRIVTNLPVRQSATDMLGRTAHHDTVIRSGRDHLIVFTVQRKELTGHILLIYMALEFRADVNIFALLLGNIAGILQVVQDNTREISILNRVNAFELSTFNTVRTLEEDCGILFKPHSLAFTGNYRKNRISLLISNDLIAENDANFLPNLRCRILRVNIQHNHLPMQRFFLYRINTQQ